MNRVDEYTLRAIFHGDTGSAISFHLRDAKHALSILLQLSELAFCLFVLWYPNSLVWYWTDDTDLVALGLHQNQS